MKYAILKSAVLFMAVFASGTSFAQDTKDSNKDKLNQYDEIIIKKKSDNDKNSKITIEINDGVVTVNGKPLAEFNDDDLSIRRKKIVIHGPDGDMAFNMPPMPPNAPNAPRSPFRMRSYGNMDAMSNAGFLGVLTEKDNGAKITEVTAGSPAEKAGLKAGDIITKVDDIVINAPEDLTKAISSYKPDEKVTLTYKRGKKEQKLTTALAKRPDDMPMARNYDFNFSPDMDIDLRDLDALKGLGDMKQFYYRGPGSNGGSRLGIKAQDTEDGKGVKVLDVEDASNAAKAGIKTGDIITSYNGKNIASTEELINASREAKDKSSIPVKINRNGKTQDVEIKIAKKLRTANL